MSLLELTSCDFIKAHAAEIVLINLRYFVSLLDQFVAFLTVFTANCGVWLGFHKVQLMASEHIYSPDSLLLILEQVTLLHTVFETVLPKSLRQQTRELLSLAIAVVHQLEIREMLVKECNKSLSKLTAISSQYSMLARSRAKKFVIWETSLGSLV